MKLRRTENWNGRETFPFVSKNYNATKKQRIQPEIYINVFARIFSCVKQTSKHGQKLLKL